MNTQLWIPEIENQKDVSRRSFLKFGVSSFLGLIAMQHLQTSAFSQIDNIVPHSKHCIVLFMNGGPSQLDTFDPKPGTLNGGSFAAIPTSVKGVQFSEHLPLLAEQAHQLSIIR